MNLHTAYAGKKVFVTGHTGFKGTWLVEYLRLLGADVTGYSLPDDDVNHTSDLQLTMISKHFDYFFHLAAQSQVGVGYEHPLHTYKTNVIGTVNFLEGLRIVYWNAAAVVVTTDKVYRHGPIGHAFREDEALGGHDPYSSSKACADLAAQSWQQSWLKKSPVWMATARSGNAIGGGDSNLGRIVPNFFSRLKINQPVSLWMPNAIRPWLHVMDAVEGYLTLGAKLLAREAHATAYNFGPEDLSFKGHRTVKELVQELITHCGGSYEENVPQPFFEQPSIYLNCERAYKHLGWKARIPFTDAVRLTAEWHKNPGAETTRQQIRRFLHE